MFPISRDPPEGGTFLWGLERETAPSGFQFLGIPPKGEQPSTCAPTLRITQKFPISRDPPEGGTPFRTFSIGLIDKEFPISRDPPEGGTKAFIYTEYDKYIRVSNF